ncbi:MAG TPA: HIT domain-containing protein [Pyrinomonadaceae bacterium]|nr:HIT domain-containing protein [Pyrinomonadaceae bacterium]
MTRADPLFFDPAKKTRGDGALERLWSPWRYEYIASGGVSSDPPECVFCRILNDPKNDENNFVLHRAPHNFVLLNLYPYISGHLLIVPNQHVRELDEASKETTDELMDLTKQAQTALRETYKPPGFNIGMNLGAAAGAGVKEHIHIHILPRWVGDTNFMSTIGNTRVLPEDLTTTYQKLRGRF